MFNPTLYHSLMTIQDKTWVYPLKIKDEVFIKFKEWETHMKFQTENKIRHLKTDNGTKFCNDQFNKYFSEHRIIKYKIVAYTTYQDRLANRMNMTLFER